MAAAAAGSRPHEYLCGLTGLQQGTTYYCRSGHGTAPTVQSTPTAMRTYWSFTTVILYRRLQQKRARQWLDRDDPHSIFELERECQGNRYEYCYDTTNDGKCSNWVSTGVNRGIGLPTLQSSTTYYCRSGRGTGHMGQLTPMAAAHHSGHLEHWIRVFHVLDNCSMYATNNTSVHLVCEIYTNTSSNIENVKLYIDIFNSLGAWSIRRGVCSSRYYSHSEKACIDISFPDHPI